MFRTWNEMEIQVLNIIANSLPCDEFDIDFEDLDQLKMVVCYHLVSFGFISNSTLKAYYNNLKAEQERLNSLPY